VFCRYRVPGLRRDGPIPAIDRALQNTEQNSEGHNLYHRDDKPNASDLGGYAGQGKKLAAETPLVECLGRKTSASPPSENGKATSDSSQLDCTQF